MFYNDIFSAFFKLYIVIYIVKSHIMTKSMWPTCKDVNVKKYKHLNVTFLPAFKHSFFV